MALSQTVAIQTFPTLPTRSIPETFWFYEEKLGYRITMEDKEVDVVAKDTTNSTFGCVPMKPSWPVAAAVSR